MYNLFTFKKRVVIDMILPAMLIGPEQLLIRRHIWFKVSVSISPGTHASEAAINKQLADKERVAAALENSHLLTVVNQCLDVGSRED